MTGVNMKLIKPLLTAGLLVATVSAFAQEAYIGNHLIVKFKSGVAADQQMRVHQQMRTTVLQKVDAIGWTLVKIPTTKSLATVEADYIKSGYIAQISKNPTIKLFATPNDPDFSKQWGPVRVNAPLAWDINTGSPAATVAIIDSGVDIDHPDLVTNLLPGTDVGDNDSNPDDVIGHGTHCAGIAGAAGNNGIGIAGIGWTNKILPVKIIGTNGGFAAVAGIVWATDNGADVLSMSFGVSDHQALRDAIDYAWNKNVLPIAAAGNDGDQRVNLPAGLDKVLAVANSLPDDTRSPSSTFGQWVDVAAPGTDIWSTVPGGAYENKTGTSMSCPLVAGIAGLIYSVGGDQMTNERAWEIITSTSLIADVDYVKYGRVDAFACLENVPTYETVTSSPTSLSLFLGRGLTGTPAQVAVKDGKVASAISVFDAKLGSTAGIVLNYKIPSPIAVYKDPRFAFTAKTDVTSTLMLFFYNWKTNTYDFSRSIGMNATMRDANIFLPPNSANYVDASRNVRILARVHVPVTRGRSVPTYRFSIDQGRFEGEVQAN